MYFILPICLTALVVVILAVLLLRENKRPAVRIFGIYTDAAANSGGSKFYRKPDGKEVEVTHLLEEAKLEVLATHPEYKDSWVLGHMVDYKNKKTTFLWEYVREGKPKPAYRMPDPVRYASTSEEASSSSGAGYKMPESNQERRPLRHSCTNCGGSGRLRRTGYEYDIDVGECPICEGVGALVCKEKWVPEKKTKCERCKGRGYDLEPDEVYPSGKPVGPMRRGTDCYKCTSGFIITPGKWVHYGSCPDFSARGKST